MKRLVSLCGPRPSAFRPRAWLLSAALLPASLLSANHARAQGCAQCRDNLAGVPAATQLAYRHAIELLAGSGVIAFSAGLLLLRRHR